MQTFQNLICGREVSLHTVLVDGAPWFRGNDIADSLDYANSHQAIRHHIDEEDRAPLKDLIKDSDATPLKYNEGAQTFINEFGLYSLILGSRKPQAKIMQRWVTHGSCPTFDNLHKTQSRHKAHIPGHREQIPRHRTQNPRT